MVIGVSVLLGAFHILHVSLFDRHVSSYESEDIPRFEAASRLEDWSYAILSGVNAFSGASSTDDLSKAYDDILKDIVELEAAASDQALFVGRISNLELNRLIEGLKHSLNTTLALKIAALRSEPTANSEIIRKQIALNKAILFKDLENLRALAIQNRTATFEASRTGFAQIFRRVRAERQAVAGMLLMFLAATTVLAWRSLRRVRDGLSEVSEVLHKERSEFSPNFFSIQDEFTTIGEKVQHYIRKEALLRQAEKKAAESELKAEAYEGAIANLTHDLRTPASQISGLLELIEQQHLDGEDSAREMQMAQAASRRLSSMVQDILDVTRTELDRAEAVMSAFDPGKLSDELVTSFRFTAELRQLKLRFDNRLTLSSVLQDGKRIERIMANLIDNAIKYTNSGSVSVKVSNSPIVDGRSDIIFEVEDTGIGIPEEQVQGIFEKFSRARNHYAIDGLGLGLALVSNFADLLGGTVSVESQVNRGTRFSVTIPCEVLEETRAEETPETASACEAKPHVLLVEDDPVNMAFADAVLKSLARVTCAGNGQEAVQKFQQDDFDLVIMDWRMPIMDGVSATREIRHLEKQCSAKRTPIWGLTANASPEERNRALDAGMEDLLAKPLSKKIAQQLMLS